MTASEFWLSVVAFRLAALLLTGLILQALPSHSPATAHVGATVSGPTMTEASPSVPDTAHESSRDLPSQD